MKAIKIIILLVMLSILIFTTFTYGITTSMLPFYILWIAGMTGLLVHTLQGK